MPDANPAGLVEALIGGARQAGHRMVLHSGWSKLHEVGRDGRLGDDVLVVEDVPHAWLFPRMAAVVHHGGAGTAALRAGTPAAVSPLFADQFFWGPPSRFLLGPAKSLRLAQALPDRPRKLTDVRLAAALKMLTPDHRAAAQRIAQALACEKVRRPNPRAAARPDRASRPAQCASGQVLDHGGPSRRARRPVPVRAERVRPVRSPQPPAAPHLPHG